MRTRKNRTGKNIGKSKKLKRRLRKKISRKRGGTVMGEGSSGIVFADPRLPCEDEDTVPIDGKASKLFTNSIDAELEFKEAEVLKKSGIDAVLLAKYFILPEKNCTVNKQLLTTDKQYTSPEWLTDLNSEKHELPKNLKSGLIRRVTGLFGRSNPPTILISEKGKYSLFDYLRQTDEVINPNPEGANLTPPPVKCDTVLKFLNLFKQLINILNGIELLHSNGFFYGDLKLDNAVVTSNETIKIIDIGSLIKFGEIENFRDSIQASRNAGGKDKLSNQGKRYIEDRAFTMFQDNVVTVSPLAIFSSLFFITGTFPRINSNVVIREEWLAFIIKRIKASIEYIKKDAEVGTPPTIDSVAVLNYILIKINHLLTPVPSIFSPVPSIFSPFISTETPGDRIKKIIDNLILQIKFGNTGDIVNGINEGQIRVFLNNFLDNKNNKNAYINDRETLFKLIDIYAFGYIILEIIYFFLIRGLINQLKEEQKLAMINVIVELFNIVEMCCSYDRPEVIPITKIIDRYTNNLLPLIDTAILKFPL